MFWDQLRSKDFAEIPRGTPVLLPLAATEQHGPHLPLATDRMIAEHFVRTLDQRQPDAALILPVVAIGCSDHHMAFPGTLTLRHENFRATALDLLDSARIHGFTSFFLLNAHGGNQSIGGVITEQFGRANPGCTIAFGSWWQLAREPLAALTTTGPGGVGHACEFETSLMMRIAPELVDVGALPQKSNRATFAWAEGDMLRGPKVTLYRTMGAMTPTGAFGEPHAASAALGDAITSAVIATLLPMLIDLKTTP